MNARHSASALAAWAWHPSLWLRNSDRLLARAHRMGIGLLYIGLRIDEGRVANAPALLRFLADAADRGIAIAAVEGDPNMALSPEGLDRAVDRAAVIRRFRNEGQTGLSHVQYDIEPYARARWTGSPLDHQRWGFSLERLASEHGEPIEAVLPFWVRETASGQEMLDDASSALAAVVVMAYRTMPNAIATLAEPLASWSRSRCLPVRLAVECGIRQPADISFRGGFDQALAAARGASESISTETAIGIAIHGIDWAQRESASAE